jgi:hypothetical protein
MSLKNNSRMALFVPIAFVPGLAIAVYYAVRAPEIVYSPKSSHRKRHSNIGAAGQTVHPQNNSNVVCGLNMRSEAQSLHGMPRPKSRFLPGKAAPPRTPYEFLANFSAFIQTRYKE